MNLSQNITLDDFIKSQTATRNNIKAQFDPPANVVQSAKLLCENVIEKIKILIPDVSISSGYRCEELNKLIGGSSTSQHCKGEAVDLVCKSNLEIAKAVLSAKIPFDQMILEGGTIDKPDWIHISYSTKNRGQILRADFIKGKAIYSTLTKEQILK